MRFSHQRGAILVTALASIAALLSSCSAEPRDRPNVVVVLVDELRKDSADQWLTQTRRLAEGGIVVENMRSAAPWTYPSVISLMSGLYPQQHNADGHLIMANRLTTFDEKLPLVPALLHSAGYHTAAFVTNPFLHTWNPFHEAFDHYDVGFINSQGNMRGLRELVWTKRMFSDSVNPAILKYFDGRPLQGPEFTYVHYIDVHGPWDDAPFEPDYETSVRYLDAKIVEIYEYFSARYQGELLFFVTSDHGRELGDDLEIGEGKPWRRRKASMHDFNLRIPFYVLPSARVSEPSRVIDACSNVDFAPTLLDWLGIDPPEGAPGASLLPAIGGQPARADRALYAKTSAFGFLTDAMVYDDKKYVRYWRPQDRQLVGQRVFDLEQDPREIASVATTFGTEAARLEEIAGNHGVSYRAQIDAIDPELLGKLNALGYLEGGAPEAPVWKAANSRGGRVRASPMKAHRRSPDE